MIVGPDYVFVAVPRTASISIARYWLMEHYGGRPVPGTEHHCRSVPPEHRGKPVFAVVRDPYERMASLWSLFKQRWRRFAVFDDFLRHCIERTFEKPVFLCQWDFLAGVEPRIDHVVRYERLEDGLQRLNFVRRCGFHPLPTKNTRLWLEGRRRPFVLNADSSGGHKENEALIDVPELYPERSLTRAQLDLINEHSKMDFIGYGYEMR